MQKHININVNVFSNSFNKCKLKIIFLLEIYLKAILNLEYYEQTTITIRTLDRVFIAKSSQQILKLVCFIIM